MSRPRRKIYTGYHDKFPEEEWELVVCAPPDSSMNYFETRDKVNSCEDFLCAGKDIQDGLSDVDEDIRIHDIYVSFKPPASYSPVQSPLDGMCEGADGVKACSPRGEEMGSFLSGLYCIPET